MFSKVLFVALLGLCCASFFENGLKKLAPYRNVQHFAMNNMPKEVNDEVRSKWGGQAQDLLAKIRSSLLLRGAPLGSFRPQQLLPLFVRSVSCAVCCSTYESHRLQPFLFVCLVSWLLCAILILSRCLKIFFSQHLKLEPYI